jgi:L-ascorbate metabolism protein UlaG (beta-lactamase superfamily)
VDRGLRLTYIGHASVLIELDGARILTDPILGHRVGPLRRAGPTPDPADIGPIDAVLVSHGHPDHFQRSSLRAVHGSPLVVVPRGLGTSAEMAGHRVREVTVNDRVDIGGVRITTVPARHGRWPRHPGARPIGFLIEGSQGVYFAGDTALHPAMARLGGHVDVALLPVGRWGPPRGPARLTPSTAVDAATLVGARTAIPIHWGTLYLPGFRTGRWGWGSFDAGDAFAMEAAERAPDLEVRVLGPGEATDIDAADPAHPPLGPQGSGA